jgi:hypothetical protein
MSTVYSPHTWSIPADIAISMPKLRASLIRRTGRPAAIHSLTIALDPSVDPSSTMISSYSPAKSVRALLTRSHNCGRLSCSLRTGMTSERIGLISPRNVPNAPVRAVP